MKTKYRHGSSVQAKSRRLLAGFAVMCIAAVFSFTLLGCDSDPGDDSPTTPTTPAEIRGTWQVGETTNALKIGEKGLETGEWRDGTFTGTGSTYDYKKTFGKYHKFRRGASAYYYVYLDDANLKTANLSYEYSEA